jgi:hypothetical protein
VTDRTERRLVLLGLAAAVLFGSVVLLIVAILVQGAR